MIPEHLFLFHASIAVLQQVVLGWVPLIVSSPHLLQSFVPLGVTIALPRICRAIVSLVNYSVRGLKQAKNTALPHIISKAAFPALFEAKAFLSMLRHSVCSGMRFLDSPTTIVDA